MHGSHVLLIKRSNSTEVWPNFWAFPGGKVDANELFREAALREAEEEIGIIGNPENINAQFIQAICDKANKIQNLLKLQ